MLNALASVPLARTPACSPCTHTPSTFHRAHHPLCSHQPHSRLNRCHALAREIPNQSPHPQDAHPIGSRSTFSPPPNTRLDCRAVPRRSTSLVSQSSTASRVDSTPPRQPQPPKVSSNAPRPEWQAEGSAGRGQFAAPPQPLVTTSRRRILSHVSMVGLVAGLCVCCPSLASASEWTYGDIPRLKNWGGVCTSGSLQSPIDIPIKSAGTPMGGAACSTEAAIIPNYGKVQGTVINTGHALQVKVESGAGVTIGERRLALLQFHWHRTSEHTMDGRRRAMELHLVHQDEDTGSLAVLAILLHAEAAACGKLGSVLPGANRALADAITNAPARKGISPESVEFNLLDLLPKERTVNGSPLGIRPYVHYAGSLTTPPCSEKVDWFVFADPAVVEAGQVLEYEESLQVDGIVFGHNARPIQPLGGRKLEYYGLCGGEGGADTAA